MKYFIMINCGNGKITPLSDDDGVMLFDSEAEAWEIADNNSMAIAHGYQTYTYLC